MLKKYFLLVTALCFLFAGCGSDNDGEEVIELDVIPVSLELGYEGNRLPVVVNASSSWVATAADTWCKLSLVSGTAGTDTLFVSADENQASEARNTTVTISIDGLSRKLAVAQKAYSPDGAAYAYLTATKGQGVKVVVMGDGFTLKDMAKGGKYEQAMEQAVEHLLDIEPFKSYRDYFTAYVVKAVSNDEGISSYNEGMDTRFRAKYVSATSTTMTCDTATCFRYACKAPIDNKLNETLIILVTNSSRYAGSTYMYTDGASIAICPMAQDQPYNNFKGIIQHEAGGHGFAKLIDEYIYNSETIPEDQARKISENEQYGFYANASLTGELSAIKWKHFIGQPGYESVGAYEGCFKYGKGVWRPEQISCMDDMRPYFNAPSREAIVKRICQLAGISYSLSDFMANDKAAGTAAATSSLRSATQPLPAPVVIKGSPAVE